MSDNKPIGYVYKTTNLINGLIYIGQHKYTYQDRYDKYYLGAGKKLKKAIKEFGSKNFQKEILEECNNQQELDEKEKYYIKYFNSTDENIGYNILFGGFGGHNGVMTEESKNKIAYASSLRCKDKHPMFGKHLSEERKKQISNAMKGKTKTQEHRDKLSKSMKGKKVSNKTKSKIRNARLGKKLSEETKLKISESMKRYKNLNQLLDQIQGKGE